MEDSPAIYNGRIVSKGSFRTFIYAPCGKKKLVESWDQFQKHMETGVWFSSFDKIKKESIDLQAANESENYPVIQNKTITNNQNGHETFAKSVKQSKKDTLTKARK